MTPEFQIKVIYHQQTDKAMRAINFFTAGPTLLGMPLYPNTVILADLRTLEPHKVEISPLMEAKVISVTRIDDGTPFEYHKNRFFGPDILSEEDLLAEVMASVDRQIRADLTGSPSERLSRSDIPPSLEPEQVSRVALELPPEIPIEPGPTRIEPLSSKENDDFFEQVKAYADARRGTGKKAKRRVG